MDIKMHVLCHAWILNTLDKYCTITVSDENEEEQYTILNPNISLKTFNNITTTQNPNYLDIIIAHTMFYGGGEPHSRIPNKLLLMMKLFTQILRLLRLDFISLLIMKILLNGMVTNTELFQ